MTFKDFKVKAKKIFVILNLPFFPKVAVGTYRHKGYVIYEDLYAATDFYCQVGFICVQGSFRHMIACVDRTIREERILLGQINHKYN